ncbi:MULTISPECIES: PTS sugar transporter subunit IIA [unclassified Actinomyces]|uniref:PTS sugar transporter subunit IIA n=1 Tax=unclassified Actinomyces TaxID=2609248 RepID=UPI002017F8BD|nr:MULTISPECIES: PTS sugar transporter subunit IIA [unclassified Actinomyces]MCL3777187.1 PTS sugar transporter subunit IIA [Actinomyces sp. AC-20-1]MCL3788989.1 PTS sugar transporter subunit IIA [Actinomyces sp. 187325]MCL3791344.1 PTS sugar transporter subunit IIA [Actinomyces sp. 186855]MCL3793945.1 PTS sugar transporter subunit IIA [Actinomyces sp. 217892]
MHQDLLRRDLVQLDWEVDSQDEFFDRVVARLQARGYVKDTFLAALKAREETYPTALPTQPEAIAIPHSDAVHVITPFIAVTRLARPVTWHEMANNDATHPVRFIFLLGLTKEDGHVEVLQLLLDRFQDPSFMDALSAARTEDELFDALATMSGPQA